MKRYFLFAGEPSGDLHGSCLIQSLSQIKNDLTFFGVGGPLMRQEAFKCIEPMENFQVMGYSDVLKSLPRLWKLFYKVQNQILNLNPDCVILIDYPGFNLRLAASLRRKGFKGKLVQYICPSVWAHGKKRIQILANHFDLLLTIFPFEAQFFSHTSLKVEYVGNPLIKKICQYPYQGDWKKQTGLPNECELFALFPGSRLSEIKRHIPLQLEIAQQLKQKAPHLVFGISCAQKTFIPLIYQYAMKSNLKLNSDLFIIPASFQYELMKDCQTALAKSGTVTLELAIHSVPSVVHYELSLMNYLIAKYFIQLNLPHYCIVNILGEKTIFPELINRKIPMEKLKYCVEQIHFNTSARQKIKTSCQELVHQLKNDLTHLSAAAKIVEMTQ